MDSAVELTTTLENSMGNTCIKDPPEISMTCVNSGNMSSCCHQSEPNDEYRVFK